MEEEIASLQAENNRLATTLAEAKEGIQMQAAALKEHEELNQLAVNHNVSLLGEQKEAITVLQEEVGTLKQQTREQKAGLELAQTHLDQHRRHIADLIEGAMRDIEDLL